MPRTFPLLLACLLPVAAASGQDLRAALQALRNGAPGEPEFDRALPLLPQMLTSESSTMVLGAAYLDTVAMLLARRGLLEEPRRDLDKVRFVVEFADHRAGDTNPPLPRDSGDPNVVLRSR